VGGGWRKSHANPLIHPPDKRELPVFSFNFYHLLNLLKTHKTVLNRERKIKYDYYSHALKYEIVKPVKHMPDSGIFCT
jgi:hypothetical protein